MGSGRGRGNAENAESAVNAENAVDAERQTMNGERLAVFAAQSELK